MIKLFLTLIVAALAVSAHAQETVGGLVCGQTYDYDYIISVLGEPDYVSHDMYEFLVYKEKRPVTESKAVVAGPPVSTVHDRYTFSPPAVPGVEVRVGDPIDKVRKFPGTLKDRKFDKGGGELFWSYKQVDPNKVMWSMYPYFCYDKNGVITSIEYYYD